MAAYPSIPIHISSRVRLLDDIKVSRARGGLPRARRWYSSTRVGEFRVVHVGLTAAQRTELETFLRTYRKTTFDFPWCFDGSIHVVFWADSSLEWEDIGAGLSNTELTLIPAI